MLVALDNGSFIHSDDPGEPKTGKPRISITDEEGRLLAFLAAGRRVAEIGTGLGRSTGYLASTAKRVTTIDIDPWVAENIWPYLPDNVVATSERRELLVDLVFIDGSHTASDFAADVTYAERICPNGLLVAHDANQVCDRSWWIIQTTHSLGLRLA